MDAPTTPAPTASVIVCTYDRCRSLQDTLQALQRQVVPADLEWELIVVDNNSSDDTRPVVEGWQRDMPNLRYEFESRQGLSFARNRGIALARGEFVLFTDDDVAPEADWIAATVSGMRQHGGEACGGYIAPAWESPPPAWLTARFHGFLAIRMDEEGPRFLGPAEDPPFGANMAFRREVFARIGVFDVDLGHKGSVLAGGEEWDLFRRLRADQGRILYLPAARVHHRVEAFRLRKNYFRRWRYQNSRNLAQTHNVSGERRIFGVPPYLVTQTLSAMRKSVASYATRPADEAFRTEMIVWHFLGMIAGLRRSRARRSGPAATTRDA